ncbi:paraquat-inducible protein A [Colwellia sp. D2M02]|uniref:paraquat-inducible protein A n=1 Tax=Colwellia sp. D2M02 TaxID=2841562 RepID=UPI001C088ABE|nr:paraquat-inducible protein A [Colwellia sp. D2M02]MBU2895030.1 paraquat-inducible protein A [Colwellia sp. D2M02]
MTQKKQPKQWVACQQCDALFDKPLLKQGQSAKCTRCGSVLVERKVDSIERSFHWSLAGLILMLPAILLPLMGVTLAGQHHQASLFDCVLVLIERDFFMIASLLFLFAIAVPIVRLSGALYLSYSFKFNRLKPSLLNFFRAYHHLDHWAMLNVFMLGIVVSMYKLLDDTELSVNLGLLSFILWLVCSTMASAALDQDYIWEELEQAFLEPNTTDEIA